MFKEAFKKEIRQKLAQEFKLAQECGFERTKAQFEKELHSRLFQAGIQTNYVSVYVKI